MTQNKTLAYDALVGQDSALCRSTTKRVLDGLTHRSIGTLAQLLQLLERARMSFAIHICGRELRRAMVRELSLGSIGSWMSKRVKSWRGFVLLVRTCKVVCNNSGLLPLPCSLAGLALGTFGCCPSFGFRRDTGTIPRKSGGSATSR